MAAKKGLELVWYGSTAKAYSACFGSWRKVTEVYAMLYGKDGKGYNTGRVSIAIKQLSAAGYLSRAKDKSTTWRLYTATADPIFHDAMLKGVSFNAEEKKSIEQLLCCAAKSPPGTALQGPIHFDRDFFVPALAQGKDALQAARSLAIIYLFYQHLDGGKLQSYLGSLRQAIEGTSGRDATPHDIYSQFSGKLAMETRIALGKGTAPEEMTLFRLAKYLYPDVAYAEMMSLAAQA